MSNQTSDLQYVADGWQPWMTPKGLYQALQQGGLFVFQGEQLAFSHYDQVSVDGGVRGERMHVVLCCARCRCMNKSLIGYRIF